MSRCLARQELVSRARKMLERLNITKYVAMLVAYLFVNVNRVS
jgi:hypothetical protein